MKFKSVFLVSVLMMSVISSYVMTTTVHAATPEELQQNVDEMFDETSNIFGDLKDKYTGLADNYGNIEIKNTDDVYGDYLNKVQESKDKLGIDKKLEEIKNTDLSYDNSDLQKQFDDAKKDAANKLSEAKMGSDAIMKKFNAIQKEQSEKQKKIEKERIKAAETRYNKIAAGYNSTLKQTATNGHFAKPKGLGVYKASDLKYLSNAMGINFNEAVTQGKLGVISGFVAHLGNEVSKIGKIPGAINNLANRNNPNYKKNK